MIGRLDKKIVFVTTFVLLQGRCGDLFKLQLFIFVAPLLTSLHNLKIWHLINDCAVQFVPKSTLPVRLFGDFNLVRMFETEGIRFHTLSVICFVCLTTALSTTGILVTNEHFVAD